MERYFVTYHAHVGRQLIRVCPPAASIVVEGTEKGMRRVGSQAAVSGLKYDLERLVVHMVDLHGGET